MKKLGFPKCQIVNIESLTQKSYFSKLDEILPSIESLDLYQGRWLSNHSLQGMCKSPTLSRLNLQGCTQVGETFVYTALATRFGFRNVTFLDLRDTFVGDSEVPCFGRLPNLEQIHFGRTGTKELSHESSQDHFESRGVISDHGVVSLCMSEEADKRSVIKVFSLTRTEISDKSLTKLAAVYPLKVLDITGSTKISNDAIQSYMKRRPTCSLIY